MPEQKKYYYSKLQMAELIKVNFRLPKDHIVSFHESVKFKETFIFISVPWRPEVQECIRVTITLTDSGTNFQFKSLVNLDDLSSFIGRSKEFYEFNLNRESIRKDLMSVFPNLTTYPDVIVFGGRQIGE